MLRSLLMQQSLIMEWFVRKTALIIGRCVSFADRRP